MDLKLKGKRALIAGSSKGIGYAIALGLANEGCRVAINSRNPQSISDAANKIHAETNSEIVPITGDIGQPDFPLILVQKTIQAFNGLDLLVTNAGGPPSGKFDRIDEAAWQDAIDVITAQPCALDTRSTSLFTSIRLRQCCYSRPPTRSNSLSPTSYSQTVSGLQQSA